MLLPLVSYNNLMRTEASGGHYYESTPNSGYVFDGSRPPLDDKDVRIGQLRLQGRLNVEIAKEVGLSPTTVGRRIGKMEGREPKQWQPPSVEARASLQAEIDERVLADDPLGITELAKKHEVTLDIARGAVTRAMDTKMLQSATSLFPEVSETIDAEMTSRAQIAAIFQSMDTVALRDAERAVAGTKFDLVHIKREEGDPYAAIKGAPSIRALEKLQDMIITQQQALEQK